MKKIAICLYGQPRDYIEGFQVIKSFVNNQQNVDVDFFFHCWTIENSNKYASSPWRNIDSKSLIVDDIYKIKNDLLELYKPKKFLFENSINHFDKSIYINTIAYKNTNGLKLNNINNTISQIYSRSKVRDILCEYLLDTKVEYDFIILTRYDFKNKINVNVNDLEKYYIYTSNICFPRKIIPDNFIICEQSVFLKCFNIFKNLKNILNNEHVYKIMKENNECLIINPEEIITASILNNFNFDIIKYSIEIPDFK